MLLMRKTIAAGTEYASRRNVYMIDMNQNQLLQTISDTGIKTMKKEKKDIFPCSAIARLDMYSLDIHQFLWNVNSS